MLEEDDIESNLKVIDFGTCTILKDKTFMHEIAGTVRVFREIGLLYCSRGYIWKVQ